MADEYRHVYLVLTVPVDRNHLNMVQSLKNSMHTSEPVVITADGYTADVFVHDFDYGTPGAFNRGEASG